MPENGGLCICVAARLLKAESYFQRAAIHFFRGATSRLLTRAPLGYLAERDPLGGGGGFCPPPLPNSRTGGSSEVDESANESSQ